MVERRLDMMTRIEAAQYLGMSVSWLAANKYTGPDIIQLGRKVYYLKSDLDAFIESRRNPMPKAYGFEGPKYEPSAEAKALVAKLLSKTKGQKKWKRIHPLHLHRSA